MSTQKTRPSNQTLALKARGSPLREKAMAKEEGEMREQKVKHKKNAKWC